MKNGCGMISRCSGLVLLALMLVMPVDRVSAGVGDVTLRRVPGGGIQPHLTVEPNGRVHVVYLKTSVSGGDVYYIRREPGEYAFTEPIRVNSEEGCASVQDHARGPQLASGMGGRVHVVWKGIAEGPEGESPLWYARLDDVGAAFEAQRNMMQRSVGLDGGGSVAADRFGNVYVIWHAWDINDEMAEEESKRRIWTSISSDDGESFRDESPVAVASVGASQACALRTVADRGGNIFILFRSAKTNGDRDIYLLTSRDQGKTYGRILVQKGKSREAQESAAWLGTHPDGAVLAWETDGQVYYATVEGRDLELSMTVAAPGPFGRRHFPTIAVDDEGLLVLAWTEGMEPGRGGRVAWQTFDEFGSRVADQIGHARGVAPWGFVAAFADANAGFTILY